MFSIPFRGLANIILILSLSMSKLVPWYRRWSNYHTTFNLKFFLSTNVHAHDVYALLHCRRWFVTLSWLTIHHLQCPSLVFSRFKFPFPFVESLCTLGGSPLWRRWNDAFSLIGSPIKIIKWWYKLVAECIRLYGSYSTIRLVRCTLL